jgi:hypothetical protein
MIYRSSIMALNKVDFIMGNMAENRKLPNGFWWRSVILNFTKLCPVTQMLVVGHMDRHDLQHKVFFSALKKKKMPNVYIVAENWANFMNKNYKY